jgi:hypothetical protein
MVYGRAYGLWSTHAPPVLQPRVLRQTLIPLIPSVCRNPVLFCRYVLFAATSYFAATHLVLFQVAATSDLPARRRYPRGSTCRGPVSIRCQTTSPHNRVLRLATEVGGAAHTSRSTRALHTPSHVTWPRATSRGHVRRHVATCDVTWSATIHPVTSPRIRVLTSDPRLRVSGPGSVLPRALDLRVCSSCSASPRCGRPHPRQPRWLTRSPSESSRLRRPCSRTGQSMA